MRCMDNHKLTRLSLETQHVYLKHFLGTIVETKPVQQDCLWIGFVV